MGQHFDESKEEELGLLQGMTPDQSPMVAFDEPPALPPSPKRHVKRVLIALAVVLTLASSVLVAWIFVPRPPRPPLPPSYRSTFHLPPASPLDPTLWSVTLPTGNHTVTCVVIHGLGDDRYMLPFRQLMPEAEYPWIKWVVPQAPWITSTVDGNATRKGWYNIWTFADLHYKEDEAGLMESQRQINKIIVEEREILRAQGKEGRIALAGFSQGAVMSLLNILSSVEKIDAAVILSGYLALPDKIKLLAEGAPRDMPVFWGHGIDDPILTEAHATEDAETLRQPPFSFTDLTYKTYAQVQHYWSQTEMADLKTWFSKHVPQYRDP